MEADSVGIMVFYEALISAEGQPGQGCSTLSTESQMQQLSNS
jgi:hypothetical protein